MSAKMHEGNNKMSRVERSAPTPPTQMWETLISANPMIKEDLAHFKAKMREGQRKKNPPPNTIPEGKLLWSYTYEKTIDKTDIKNYICFKMKCEEPPVEFVVFVDKSDHRRGSLSIRARFRVALCHCHLERYKTTGKMPRRINWDKLLFKGMP